MSDDQMTTNGNGEPPKIKLNLTATRPPTGPKEGAPPTTTIRVARPTEGGKNKAETTRIDLAQAQKPGETQPVEAQRAAMQTTMRVEIVDETTRKAETTRIDLAAAIPKSAPRVELSKEEAEDVFKRRTMAVGVPTPAPAAPPSRPKTIQVKKPVTQPVPGTVDSAIAHDVAQAKKSETARIDLPSAAEGDRPVTRPKTIRIKRPDGTSGRKPLVIARPDGEAAPAATLTGFPTTQDSTEGEEPAGTMYSVLALVALLIVCVLVYVLAAQSVALDLPWPGRLV